MKETVFLKTKHKPRFSIFSVNKNLVFVAVCQEGKYAVCVQKNDCIAGHLPIGTSRNFVTTIFYFLRADKYSLYKVVITGKPVKLVEGYEMQVPWKLKFTGRSKLVNIVEMLKNQNIIVLKQAFTLLFLPALPSI